MIINKRKFRAFKNHRPFLFWTLLVGFYAVTGYIEYRLLDLFFK